MSTATFLQKYKILNKIGEGSFSEVLKCQDLKMGSFMAAKRLKKTFNNWDEVNDCAEVITMHKLPKHPNILHMTEFHFDSFLGKVTFLFELMDMSLYDFINMRKKHVHEARAKYYLYQILCGLDHLHKHGMFHRDIKPENILLRLPDDKSDSMKYEIIKIADLGSLRGIYSTPPFTEYISTRWYRSPECLLTSGYYGPKMDIWATGCVFYELLTFKPLFAGSNEVDQLTKIHKIIGTPSKRTMTKFVINKSCNYEYFPKQTGKGLAYLIPHVSSDGQTILKLMITYDPDSRCNVRRLLSHKYFKHLRDGDSHTGYKQLPTEPVGDYKSNSMSCTKSLTSQNLEKYEQRHKRTYYEMQNSQIKPKEKSGKTDNTRSRKRSYNDVTSTKKLKICHSQKNYISNMEYDELKPSKIYKIYKSKPRNGHTETKTVYEAKCSKSKYDSGHEVKSNKVHYHKYIKTKKESENYRNTTGNIPLLFNKIPEKVIGNNTKSFVEKKSNKISVPNLEHKADVAKLRPRPPPKVYVVDPIKNVKNSKNI